MPERSIIRTGKCLRTNQLAQTRLSRSGEAGLLLKVSASFPQNLL
jgi:hypothetical protein